MTAGSRFSSGVAAGQVRGAGGAGDWIRQGDGGDRAHREVRSRAKPGTGRGGGG